MENLVIQWTAHKALISLHDALKISFQQLIDEKLKTYFRIFRTEWSVFNLKAFDLWHHLQFRPVSFAKYNWTNLRTQKCLSFKSLLIFRYQCLWWRCRAFFEYIAPQRHHIIKTYYEFIRLSWVSISLFKIPNVISWTSIPLLDPSMILIRVDVISSESTKCPDFTIL